MTKTERRLLLAIAMMLLNPDKGRAELEAAAKALLAEKSEVK
jgi:hypothetical protein